MTYSLMDSLAYLLNRAGERTGELFARRLAPFGVTLPMYRVLAALLERDHQRLGDLGAMTSIELSTLSRLVGAMTLRGLTSRERVQGDGRAVTISLTVTGRSLSKRLVPIAIHHERVSLQDVPPDVAAQLKRRLISIHDNLDALEDELPPAGSRPAAGSAAMRPAASASPQMTSLSDPQ